MKYVYLDSNIIQYIKNSTVSGHINGPEFNEVVKSLSRKYKFPYSEGHLCDLAAKYKPENKTCIDQDLEFIFKLSNGHVLGFDPEENLLVVQKTKSTMLNSFNKLLNKTPPVIDIDVKGESYSVNTKQMSDKDLFKSTIKSNADILDPAVMKSVLENHWQNIDDPAFYKSFREQVSNLKKKFKETDTILDQDSDYFKKIMPLLNFLAANNFSMYRQNFDDVINSFLAINGRSSNGMKIGKKIQLVYSILDFNPNFRDKINNKNRPTNMVRDINNLIFASQAEYYVTEDQSTLKKARFVCDALSLNVKVLTMSDFSNRFC